MLVKNSSMRSLCFMSEQSRMNMRSSWRSIYYFHALYILKLSWNKQKPFQTWLLLNIFTLDISCFMVARYCQFCICTSKLSLLWKVFRRAMIYPLLHLPWHMVISKDLFLTKSSDCISRDCGCIFIYLLRAGKTKQYLN